MISRIIQTEVNVICQRLRQVTLTLFWIILDIMRNLNPITVLLFIQNSHTKMQAKYGSKKTCAINLAKFCYFVIFAHFEVVTSSASNNVLFAQLHPIMHSIRRKWRHSCQTLRINWSMLTKKEREMKFECIIIFIGGTPAYNGDFHGGLMKFTHVTIRQLVAQPIKRHVLW